MTDSTSTAERFAASCESASQYPQNLMRSQKLQCALKAYSNRLSQKQDDLFHDFRRSVYFWDMQESTKQYSLSTSMESVEDLKGHIASNPSPRSRFVFVQSIHHRGPMCCTIEQLTYLLTYHQVMPSFVEFCCEFISREEAVCKTLLRHEDYLVHRPSVCELPQLGRSGLHIQHAFNLLGLEERKKADAYTWPFRHVTVYHSLDIKTGKMFWLIIKGNRVMQDLITSAEEKLLGYGPEEMKTPIDALAMSLRVQLQIFEWSTCHWDDYIKDLEFEARRLSDFVTRSPVSTLISKVPANLDASRQATMEPQRRTRRSPLASQPGSGRQAIRPSLLQRFSSSLSGFVSSFVSFAQPDDGGLKGLAESPNAQRAEVPMSDVRLDHLFTFDQLQEHHGLGADVDKAIMMMEQNRRIFAEVRERYSSLAESAAFRVHFEAPFLEADILGFVNQVRSLDGDLENSQTRLRTLLRKMEKDETLFSQVLQYQSMKIGEYWSESADKSAAKMEEWTVRMHGIAERTEQETVAMGVITFFTLVLLPGTFVATFFSSGILVFDDEDAHSGEHSSAMGSWGIRQSALNLFLVLSLPLMGISLGTWAFYRSETFKRTRAKLANLELHSSKKLVDEENVSDAR